MSIPVVETIVLIIPDFYDTVFHPECITIVISHLMVIDLYDPVIKVFAVEKLLPATLLTN